MSATAQNCDDLKSLIREVPDFPKPGILFYDITTLLKDRRGFARLIDALTEYYINKDVDVVLGIEARGFIFGPALAYRLNAGFVPVRKPKVSLDLRSGVRQRYLGNPQGRHHSRTARPHLRRPAGHGRNGPRRRRDGEVAGRRNLWNQLRGGTRRSERPRQTHGLRRVLAAALRDVGAGTPKNYQMVFTSGQACIRSSAVTSEMPCACALAAMARSAGSEGKSAGKYAVSAAISAVRGTTMTSAVSESMVSRTVPRRSIRSAAISRASSSRLTAEIAKPPRAPARRIADSAARDSFRFARLVQTRTCVSNKIISACRSLPGERSALRGHQGHR